MMVKKIAKKLCALVLAGVSTLSLFACSKDGGGEVTKVYNDPDRANTTHVIAVVTGGGIGSKWLDSAAERFAEKQYEHSYASGKKGVYIESKPVLGFNSAGLKNTSDNMFFLGREIETLLADDSVLDITDFVKDETREGGSLESRMLNKSKAMCMSASGKYYALPHLEMYGGLNYDRQAFDACNAYFAASDAANKKRYQASFSSEMSADMVGNASDKKSAGPDGTFGTEDDGLPSSLEEFLILCDYIKEETDYAPIVFSGKYVYYTNYFLGGLWAALAGAEKMSNYYNVTGEIDVIKTDADGNFLFTDENLFPGIDYIKKPQVETVTLSEDNAYRITTMVEKYYAMATLEILERQGWFSSDTYKDVDHYGAQQAFIFQGKSNKYAKAAMLIEASYWYNESNTAGCFDTYEQFTGEKAADRDLRFMCLPTRIETTTAASAKATYGNPLVETYRGIAFLNSNLKDNDEVRQACLDFLEFLYTDAELAAFTERMNLPIGMKYSLSNEQLANMSNFGRRLWNLRDGQNGTNIVYNSSTSPIYKRNHKEFLLGESCDTFWAKFAAFDGIPATSVNAYIAAMRLSKNTNADGTYLTGTKKLFITNNELQRSRFLKADGNKY